VDIDDRVLFVDNSFLKYCPGNTTPERSNVSPAGWQGGDIPAQIGGVVIRTNSVQEVYDECPCLGPRRVEMPIVVLGDDNSVIYCNAIHIRKV